MKTAPTAPLILAALVASGTVPAAGPSARPVALRLDPNATCQTFEGWGIVLPCCPFRRARDPKQAAAVYDAGPARSNYSDDLNRRLATAVVGASAKIGGVEEPAQVCGQHGERGVGGEHVSMLHGLRSAPRGCRSTRTPEFAETHHGLPIGGWPWYPS